MTYDEKRKHARFILNAKARVVFKDGLILNGNVRNMSMGGVFVEVSKLVEKSKLNQQSIIILLLNLIKILLRD